MDADGAHSIDTDVATITLQPDGLLVYRYKPGVTVTTDDAKDVVARAARIVPSPRPTLAVITGVQSIERGARLYFANDPANAALTSRIAFVTGSPISRVIANFFLGFNKPDFPTRLFSSEEAAVTWLQKGS